MPGMKARCKKIKITLNVPVELLAQARLRSKSGISQTVCQGLELIAAQDTYDKLVRLRGKIKLSLNLDQIREERE
jgi:hypothetical protein